MKSLELAQNHRFLCEEVSVSAKLVAGVEMMKADLVHKYLNSKPLNHTLHSSHYLNETTFLFIWTVKDG
jgi:hypothetical protein